MIPARGVDIIKRVGDGGPGRSSYSKVSFESEEVKDKFEKGYSINFAASQKQERKRLEREHFYKNHEKIAEQLQEKFKFPVLAEVSLRDNLCESFEFYYKIAMKVSKNNFKYDVNADKLIFKFTTEKHKDQFDFESAITL